MLNLKEEKKFAELRDKCRELKVPAPPSVFIGLKVHDKNGVLVFDDKQRGHSWTRNLWNYSFGNITSSEVNGASFGAGYLTGKSVAGNVGTSANICPDRTSITTLGYGIVNNVADANFGIVVGTGDTAFSVEQYALGSIIAYGNGAGQFAYTPQSVGTTAYNAGTDVWSSTHTRIFNNNSGGSITVKETGLYAYISIYALASHMIERSVLSPTVAVANGAQLTVTYEIEMDFSAIDA